MTDIEQAAEAFARVAQRDIDNEPCSTCGGDRLRADFTDSAKCHAERTTS